MKRIPHFLLAFLLFYGCAVIKEQVPDEVIERPLPVKPLMASTQDSTALFNAKSAIQRSPAGILSTYVVITDGEYHLSISNAELDELGISEEAYRQYVEKLSGINRKKVQNHEQE